MEVGSEAAMSQLSAPASAPPTMAMAFEDLIQDLSNRFRLLQAKNLELSKENEAFRARYLELSKEARDTIPEGAGRAKQEQQDLNDWARIVPHAWVPEQVAQPREQHDDKDIQRPREGDSGSGRNGCPSAEQASRQQSELLKKGRTTDIEAAYNRLKFGSHHSTTLIEEHGVDSSRWLVQDGPQENCLHKVARDWRFEIGCGIAIVANLVYLGVQTDFMVKSAFLQLKGKSSADHGWIIGDALFAALFSIELLIRIGAFKARLLWGRERWWNLFDTVVVVTANWEVISELAGESSPSLGTNVLRTARVFRIIRLLRVGKNWALVRNVKTILYSLAGSVWAFAATIVLLLVTMYTFGVVFMVDLEKGISSAPALSYNVSRLAALEEHYGSMGDTIWTLLASVTGGYDWAEVATPLIELNFFNAYIFALYLLCMYLGILNILNGTFVHAAMTSSTMDRELAVDAKMREESCVITDMVTLFLEADFDQSGTISWSEFQEYMQDERIKAYMMALDLDMTSLERIYKLLDADGGGELDLIEYVKGCVALRGGAKKVDISLLSTQVEALVQKIVQLEARIPAARHE